MRPPEDNVVGPIRIVVDRIGKPSEIVGYSVMCGDRTLTYYGSDDLDGAIRYVIAEQEGYYLGWKACAEQMGKLMEEPV